MQPIEHQHLNIKGTITRKCPHVTEHSSLQLKRVDWLHDAQNGTTATTQSFSFLPSPLQPPGKRGYSWELLVVLCHPFLQILTL